MRVMASKVRCVTNERTRAKAWIFYLTDGRRAYLSANKLNSMGEDLAIKSLMLMQAQENRPFDVGVELYCVQGRTQLLVHRFVNSAGIDGRKTQSRLM